jgi:hypothetical protein
MIHTDSLAAFFVCSYIRNHVYALHPTDNGSLRDKISNAHQQATPEVLDNTWRNVSA